MGRLVMMGGRARLMWLDGRSRKHSVWTGDASWFSRFSCWAFLEFRYLHSSVLGRVVNIFKRLIPKRAEVISLNDPDFGHIIFDLPETDPAVGIWQMKTMPLS